MYTRIVLTLLLSACVICEGAAQEKKFKWTTTSAKAREYASKGEEHLINLQWPLSYQQFRMAYELDKDFTIVLACIAYFSVGSTKDEFAAAAKRSAQKRSADEKLLVEAILTGSPEQWQKLYLKYPGDAMIAAFYVHFIKPQDQLNIVADYLKRYPNAGWAHNVMGYLCLSEKKDTVQAKVHFERYIQLYPQGYNPYDSMGDYYFITGDLDNSEKFYRMALERYPFIPTAMEKIREIQKLKKKTD